MAGISMENASKALGYDSTLMLRGIESEKKPIPIPVLKKMTGLYGCSADFLLGITPIMRPAEQFWNYRDDYTAISDAVKGGLIIETRRTQQVYAPEHSRFERAMEHNKNVPETTLKLEFAKYKSAYPKGVISVEYNEHSISTKLITDPKATPLVHETGRDPEVSDMYFVRCALYQLFEKAFEI